MPTSASLGTGVDVVSSRTVRVLFTVVTSIISLEQPVQGQLQLMRLLGCLTLWTQGLHAAEE